MINGLLSFQYGKMLLFVHFIYFFVHTLLIIRHFFLCFYVFLYFSIISTIFEYVLKPFCFFMAKPTFLHMYFCMFLLTQNMYKCHLPNNLFFRS